MYPHVMFKVSIFSVNTDWCYCTTYYILKTQYFSLAGKSSRKETGWLNDWTGRWPLLITSFFPAFCYLIISFKWQADIFFIIYSTTKQLLKNSCLYMANQCQYNLLLINLKNLGCLCIAVYYTNWISLNIKSFLLISSIITEHTQGYLSRESVESPFLLFCHNSGRCHF